MQHRENGNEGRNGLSRLNPSNFVETHTVSRPRLSRTARTIDPLIGIAGRQTGMELSRVRQSSSRCNLRLRVETDRREREERTKVYNASLETKRNGKGGKGNVARSNVVYRNLCLTKARSDEQRTSRWRGTTTRTVIKYSEDYKGKMHSTFAAISTIVVYSYPTATNRHIVLDRYNRETFMSHSKVDFIHFRSFTFSLLSSLNIIESFASVGCVNSYQFKMTAE